MRLDDVHMKKWGSDEEVGWGYVELPVLPAIRSTDLGL